MKRILILILGALLLLTACAPAAPGDRAITFTDDLGNTVTLNQPRRVAALLGSFADLWVLAGGSLCAAGENAWEDFGLPETEVNLGSDHEPGREALLGAEPDLVLASSKLSKHLELAEPLKLAGIPVAYFDVSDFQSFLRVFRLFTELTGREDLYEAYGTAQEEAIEAMTAAHRDEPPQTVLVMRASAASIRAKNSDGTILGGILRDFGCVNLADSDIMLLENLSPEAILRQDPDRIFFVETGDDPQGIRRNVEQLFRENPLWGELTAVQEGRVYFMERRLYNMKPNARFAEAYQKAEQILYGEE